MRVCPIKRTRQCDREMDERESNQPGCVRLHASSDCSLFSIMDPDIVPELPDGRAIVPYVAPIRPRAAGRRMPCPLLQGPLRVVLLVASVRGFWHGCYRGPETEWTPRHVADGGSVVGLLVTRWAWSSVHSEAEGALETLRRHEAARTQSRWSQGFIEYPCIAVAKLAEPVAVGRIGTAASLLETLQDALATVVVSGCVEIGRRMQVPDLLRAWRREYGRLPVDILRLTPPLAWLVLLGAIGVCHLVAIGQRVTRRRLLNPRDPSARIVKNLRFGEARLRCSRARPARKGRRWKMMHDLALMLEWLAATINVKDMRHAWTTAKSFARLFARHTGRSVAEVMGDTRRVSYQSLRRARMKLDCVAPSCSDACGRTSQTQASSFSCTSIQVHSGMVMSCLQAASKFGITMGGFHGPGD